MGRRRARNGKLQTEAVIWPSPGGGRGRRSGMANGSQEIVDREARDRVVWDI